MTLGIEEYRRLQTLTHPNKFTLALAEKLYGLEQMATATVTRKDCNKQLDPQITMQLKVKFFVFVGPHCLLRNRQNYGMAALLVLPANVKTFVMQGRRLWKLQELLIAIISSRYVLGHH